MLGLHGFRIEVITIMKDVPPSITETAFSCPHCGAYTSQSWASIFANFLSDPRKTPLILDEVLFEAIKVTSDTPSQMRELEDHFQKFKQGSPFLENHMQDKRLNTEVQNTWISICFNCKGIAIWVHDHLVFPAKKIGSPPNADLPSEICRDFNEAISIVDLSPRGAAALLRLSIQKLCVHLGERGKNINDDIASLVNKGLNPLVQQSLDLVRVIGNDAVHPGVIDIKDDRKTAERLFDLVNLVAEQMISHPKSVKEMYEKLPASKLNEIKRRDNDCKKNA